MIQKSKINLGFRYVMESAIPGNAETLKPEELHAKAWQIVEPYFLQAQQKAIALCKELIGTGKASSDISETVRAAVSL